MKVPVQHRRSRVILGATCFADAESAMRVGIALARRLDSEIAGLLIEDEAILAFASDPRATVISGPKNVTSPITLNQMMQAFRRDAVTFKTRLAKAAQEQALQWSFEQLRGRTMALLAEAARIDDLILLGHQRALLSSGDVVLVLGDRFDAEAAGLAAETSRDTRRRLTVLAPPQFQRKVAEVVSRLGIGGFSFLAATDLATVIARLGAISGSVVFVGITDLSAADLARLVEFTRTPVVFSARNILR